jgi:phosphoribosylaminoimidazole-succinocarboxamide synthase
MLLLKKITSPYLLHNNKNSGVITIKLIYAGKTKDVFDLENGKYLLKFKDDLTGENGVFDPGANTVGLTLEGAGRAGLLLTQFFFEKINNQGIPTHFIAADPEQLTMTVKKATLFGKGLEVICRYRAAGSFIRRYGLYAKEGQKLDALVEVTLKDDERNDPLITADTLEMLGILSRGEYDILKDLTKKVAKIVKDELAKKGLELYDIKFEFGRVDSDQHIALIDEISGGNMRAYRNGLQVEPLELEKIMLAAD